MPLSAGLGLLVLALICLSTGASGLITLKPSNAVAELNGQAIFYSQATVTGYRGAWYFSVSSVQSEELLIVSPPCDVKAGFDAHYKVDIAEGINTCNLIISNITMEQAGVYRYQEQDSFSALLTVTDSAPVIKINNTNSKPTGTVVENENVLIECALHYNGSVSPAPTLQPHFYWTDFNGQNISSSYDLTTENSTISQLIVTAGRQDIMPYTCHVYLRLEPTTNTGYATNTPIVSSSDNSRIIGVLYSPSTPFITTSGVSCGTNVLTCNSSGNPSPSYKWLGLGLYGNKTVISEGQSLTIAKVNESYTISCEAYNTIRTLNFTASINYTVSQSAYSSNCNINFHNGSETDLSRTIALAAVLGGYGVLNAIATIAFLLYYNRKSKTAKEMSPFKNKTRLNGRFPWLRRMLPCLNETIGNAGCTFLWVLLFILMSVLVGIIVFPILVATLANCSGERHYAKGDTDNGMSNVYQEDTIDRNAASKSGTDAHGQDEAPYDEIGTMHPGRRVILEETTSSNGKDAKKVFYTKVNPNFNAEEGVERYSVSLPS